MLCAGDCFCFDLSTAHSCTHNPQNPLQVETIYWHSLQPVIIANYYIKNNAALCAAIHQCIARQQTGYTREAVFWLQAAVSEFVVSQQVDYVEDEKISRLCVWMQANCENAFSLNDLCTKAGYSKNHIIRLFRRQTGITPYGYFLRCRVRKSISMLLYTNYSIAEIAASLGFTDAAHYSKTFKQITGFSPKQIRTNGGLLQQTNLLPTDCFRNYT